MPNFEAICWNISSSISIFFSEECVSSVSSLDAALVDLDTLYICIHRLNRKYIVYSLIDVFFIPPLHIYVKSVQINK